MEQLAFRAMGSQIMALLDADGPAATAALRPIPERFDVWEQALSRFRDDSELSMLNRAAGGRVWLSPTLLDVLAAALAAAEQTDGLVTPTMLGALERAGYDRDFAALAVAGGRPAPPAPPAPPADWRQIRLDPRSGAAFLPPGARLDLGGVAKGWAADQAVRELALAGPALVDAGGDIAVSGPRADGGPWPIGVDSPFGGDELLDLLLVRAGGVATSGRDYRRWQQGGRAQHHIIDPRTGAPAATDLLSVTVVAPSLAEAEAAAKAVLILGGAAGMAWLAARPRLAGLLACEDGAVLRSPSLESLRGRAA